MLPMRTKCSVHSVNLTTTWTQVIACLRCQGHLMLLVLFDCRHSCVPVATTTTLTLKFVGNRSPASQARAEQSKAKRRQIFAHCERERETTVAEMRGTAAEVPEKDESVLLLRQMLRLPDMIIVHVTDYEGTFCCFLRLQQQYKKQNFAISC